VRYGNDGIGCLPRAIDGGTGAARSLQQGGQLVHPIPCFQPGLWNFKPRQLLPDKVRQHAGFAEALPGDKGKRDAGMVGFRQGAVTHLGNHCIHCKHQVRVIKTGAVGQQHQVLALFLLLAAAGHNEGQVLQAGQGIQVVEGSRDAAHGQQDCGCISGNAQPGAGLLPAGTRRSAHWLEDFGIFPALTERAGLQVMCGGGKHLPHGSQEGFQSWFCGQVTLVNPVPGEVFHQHRGDPGSLCRSNPHW